MSLFQYTADQQKELQSRLSDLKGELKAKTAEIEKLSPDLKAESRAVDAIDTKVDKLETTVNAADDGVFKAFCKKIKVASIREYEDVQLKMMSEENEKMAEFVVQQNRIGHQYVPSCQFRISLTSRIEFERKQLENTRERLASLRSTIKSEKKNIAARQEQKAELEQEVQDLTKSLEKLKKKLQDSQVVQDEASDKVERARDSARKMQRELDKVLKQIAGWNDEIEKSSSDRHAIYRRCRLEEIDIPLVSGSLDKVPLVEVSPPTLRM
jgi:structural maintenance of chromosome 1